MDGCCHGPDGILPRNLQKTLGRMGFSTGTYGTYVPVVCWENFEMVYQCYISSQVCLMTQAQQLPATEATQWNKSQRGAVLAELNNILANPAFSKSKRCADLLRQLVERALSGEHEGVKERTLGVEVFGRDADYDNNADPIVRRTANEIRKRLAQYYQELDERQSVKIHLNPGSYLPEFDFLAREAAGDYSNSDTPLQIASAGVPDPIGTRDLTQRPKQITSRVHPKWFVASAVLLLAVAAGVAVAHAGLFRSSQYLFWHPLLDAKEPPIVCVADDSMLEWDGTSNNAQTIATVIASRGVPSVGGSTSVPRSIPFVDANVAHELASWLSEHGTSTVLQPASTMSLQDFRGRPAVLIGGFDNPWTLTLLSGLRFSPRLDPANRVLWIKDAQHPANHDWVYAGQQSQNSTVDYAVITRFFDSETGNWIVAIAGLGQHGTEAAGQLLADPAFAGSLPSALRSKKNFQLVVKTTLIKGETGPPQAVAFYAW